MILQSTATVGFYNRVQIQHFGKTSNNLKKLPNFIVEIPQEHIVILDVREMLASGMILLNEYKQGKRDETRWST